MKQRHFWLNRIESTWRSRNVIWLSGVRRAGKTTLCHSIPKLEYFDCELPRVRRQLSDPEAFWEGLRGKKVAIDEVHRLGNPSQLLKIAADHFPTIKVIATGSSSLGASRKFRDTLAGRKTELWLTPMMSADLEDFHTNNLNHRFLQGGLPPFFLASASPEREFQEWMDAYWAKDIQELFRLERRYSFQRFVELLLTQSSGLFEATNFARQCEVSRTTITNYLAVLEATYIAHIIRPFSKRRSTEITALPKVYGFDTGFVCYYKGWHSLRNDDLGLLWEHYVLNEIQAQLQIRTMNYWRDKRGHEVDFVLKHHGKPPIAIECKWKANGFNPSNLIAFRRAHPEGTNFVVASDVTKNYHQNYGEVRVSFTSLSDLIEQLL